MMRPLAVLRSYRQHDYSIADAFASRLERAGDRAFCVFQEREWTWQEFDAQVRRVDTVLRELGVRHGDRVAVIAQNHVGHALLLVALARQGAIMVPVNPAFGPAEAGYVLRNADVAVVACDAGSLALARNACARENLLPTLLGLDESAPGVPSLADLAARAAPADGPGAGRAEDTAVIIYTSGTTGFPKGAMHTQRSFVLAGEAFVERLHVQPDDRLMVVLPLFHMNALFYSLSGAIAAGAAMILFPRFSASTFWTSAYAHRATTVNLIEAACNILAARPRTEYVPGHRIAKIYGVRREAEEVFRRDFGVPHLISGYGMTEIPGVTSSPFDGIQKLGSMGVEARHPDPDVRWARCRVVDDHGSDLPNGTAGELVVDTPIVTQGYFRDPEQTAAAFRGPWFRTGDMVRRDDDGYFYFISRIKDIIRRRGENISGAELDRVIGAHPDVAAVATIAVPAPLGEDDILAVIVLKTDRKADARAIVDWCEARLAPMKVPRYVAFVDDLPYTPTNKILKATLRADPTLRARAFDMDPETLRR